MKAQRALDGSGWSTPPPGLFNSGKKTRYPFYRILVGPQGRFGRVWKISAPSGIRWADCPGRSETLHRLRHLGPQSEIKHDRTRDTCSARVKRFRLLDDVAPDESRNCDILVDGGIHNLEWEFGGPHRKGCIFSESEWGGLRDKHAVATWETY